MPNPSDYYDKQEAAAAQKQAEWSRKMKAATSDDGDESGLEPPAQHPPTPLRQPLRSPALPPPPPQTAPAPPQGAQQASKGVGQPLLDGLQGVVRFSQAEIDEFARRGFLKTERPDWFTMQNALFDLIDAAWAVDLKFKADHGRVAQIDVRVSISHR